MDILLQQIINGLVLGSIYALIALGYTMVYGVLGIINFAHGEVLMIGAMVSLSLQVLIKYIILLMQRLLCLKHSLISALYYVRRYLVDQ